MIATVITARKIVIVPIPSSWYVWPWWWPFVFLFMAIEIKLLKLISNVVAILLELILIKPRENCNDKR